MTCSDQSIIKNWLIKWLIYWSANDLLIDTLINESIDWFSCWLIYQSIQRSIDWLIDWPHWENRRRGEIFGRSDWGTASLGPESGAASLWPRDFAAVLKPTTNTLSYLCSSQLSVSACLRQCVFVCLHPSVFGLVCLCLAVSICIRLYSFVFGCVGLHMSQSGGLSVTGCICLYPSVSAFVFWSVCMQGHNADIESRKW